jgi:carboxymethylenebutenolidase
VTSQRDTSEEIGADQVDGLLTRREAMRRLALVGVTATPTALIAACSRGGNWPRRRRRRRH